MSRYCSVAILLLISSCGVDLKLKDSEHVVTHRVDLSGFLLDIRDFCTQAYETEEERKVCEQELTDRFLSFIEKNKEQEEE